MESRRTILKSMLASLACAGITPTQSSPGVNDWLLIADDSVNAYGRRYSEESLRILCESAKGVTVTENTKEGSEDLGDVLGIVTESKIHNASVFVRVRWFGGVTPFGFVAPWGVGRLNCSALPLLVEDYKLERIVLSDYSSFARATAICS